MSFDCLVGNCCILIATRVFLTRIEDATQESINQAINQSIKNRVRQPPSLSVYGGGSLGWIQKFAECIVVWPYTWSNFGSSACRVFIIQSYEILVDIEDVIAHFGRESVEED